MFWEAARTFFFRHKPVLYWTVGGMAAGLVVALATVGLLNVMSPTANGAREAGLAVVVSILVAMPLAFACGLMASRVGALRKQVQRLGQNDNLTSCLDEATFSALVDTYSNRNTAPGSDPLGTILLVNLDDLRVINSRFGYSWGNEALSNVAATIRGTVRNGDIVGRVSGDQFGVFLPGANETDARGVAERIHDNVAKIQFYPAGTHYLLSIRAGAVIISSRIGFDQLLRKANGTLEMTKSPGHDWIKYASLDAGAADRSKTLQ
ncbi:sensor domain-containing diguanylate cyclase [Pseudaminobacter arsenicus]|uniref:diguanylate cyclase n=1 Tax=Borborobacter arsenicus TaxID=1851146 RepID=A0A432V096_9HYPH|nr:sensor domain-containing diguanylate cyclase [Pseudaminobacter arsenicus]RUM95606.1 sensor domain-containing diguanylate cyclase [Pseudaminobacter arsenicus]